MKIKAPIKPKVIKTTDIEFFLNCDNMTVDEIATFTKEEEDIKRFLGKDNEEDEEEPEWEDVEEIKNA